jgi:hypothetical protein
MMYAFGAFLIPPARAGPRRARRTVEVSIAAPWPGGCGEWLPAPRGGGHGGIPDHVVDSITDVPTCRRESGNRPSIKGRIPRGRGCRRVFRRSATGAERRLMLGRHPLTRPMMTRFESLWRSPPSRQFGDMSLRQCDFSRVALGGLPRMAACGRLDMLPGPTHSRARHLLRSTAYLRG